MDHPIIKAAACVGSQAALAARLGVTKAAVNQWTHADRGVPLEHCAAIERATSGAVMRWDLRPTDWAAIWPELAERADAPTAPAHHT